MKVKLQFAFCMAALSMAGGAEIPKSPHDLQYPSFDYQPPRAVDYRHKLTSGATAYLVEDHELPLVNVSVLIRTGKYLEPEGKTGLAGLVGSQMRSGGTKAKPPAVFDEEAAFLAAQIGSGIDVTEGQANLNCLSKNLDACLALFGDMLQNPAFAEDRLKLAKSQYLQSLQRRNDSTTEIESRELGRLLRGDRFFTVTQPTKAGIESITREDLAAFHEKYYYPANFIFAVSGDFNSKEMLTKLEKMTSGWKNRTEAIPAVPKPDFVPVPGLYVVDKKGVNQGRVRVGHIGTTYQNPDHIPLTIMNLILGGGSFTSRIMTRVRSDEGLAYSASSSFMPGVYFDGLFLAGFQSKSPTVAQAIQIVLEEVRRIRDEKVSAEDVKLQVSYATELVSRRFATAAAKANQFANQDYEHFPEDYWRKYKERMRAVTPDDIQRVAKKYLQPDKLVILAVGNADAMLKGNPDRPRYQLSKFGTVQRIPLPDPMTMVYPKLEK